MLFNFLLYSKCGSCSPATSQCSPQLQLSVTRFCSCFKGPILSLVVAWDDPSNLGLAPFGSDTKVQLFFSQPMSSLESGASLVQLKSLAPSNQLTMLLGPNWSHHFDNTLKKLIKPNSIPKGTLQKEDCPPYKRCLIFDPCGTTHPSCLGLVQSEVCSTSHLWVAQHQDQVYL